MALKHKPTRGILLIVIAIATFSVMDTIAKYLSHSYPVGSVVWARYAINLIVLSAFMIARGEVRRIKTARPATQVVRGLMLGASTLLYFTSLTKLPLAEAASIGFVLPVFVAILAVPMLNERIDMPRVIAIVVGLSGALIVVRPGTALFTIYALLPVAMALCNAFYQILTRKIAGLEHPLTSLFYGSLIGTVMSTLAQHQDPTGMWHQVIDRPESYRELTATAMIAFSMSRGIRNGWLDQSSYLPRVQRAWYALRARIGHDGGLVDVCTGTGKQKTLRDYLDRPAILGSDPRGGAMALLLAAELAASN